MKKSKKRLIFGILVVCLAAGISAGVVYAYFTSQDEAHNRVTVGENEIAVDETFDPPKKQKSGENGYAKKVEIENTGNIPCYIRARLEFSSSDIMNKSQLSADGKTYVNAKDYPTQINTLTGGKWIYNSGDGYYYCTEKVKAGDSTAKLLDSVKTTYGENETPQRYDIIVYAESVQTYGGNGEEYNYTEAWRNFK